ncbi:GNAT family N-acetyltransferase [Nocardioides sp. LHG3406-4]|uniref:GNAT family N-acetyltransferase n=1 Tax=Nocardioides sp. LHG3406-4 TaxID=2804575 RepID=UPI003CF8CAE6
MIVIVEVDPSDETALRAFWETEQAAIRADRPHALLRTWEALSNSVREPGPYYRRTLFAAREGEVTAGVAELGGSVEDNTHLADLEISVLPDRRREGIGRALYDEALRRCHAAGRTSVCGELHVPAGVEPATAGPYAFARAMGLEEVHVEDHLVLPLPVDDGHVAILRTGAEAKASDYEIITWGDTCPDEYVDAFCEMRTRMDSDVPIGEVDYEPVVFTQERLRTSETRLAQSYGSVVSAARRRRDGVFAGYSQVYVPRGEPDVLQDDTLVMPEHRGRRLGTLLKLATLGVLAEEYPASTSIHTWTDPDNHAMQRTNRDFGFRIVERMHEMQVKRG